MGLDLVELVMALEDEFEIAIPDADAEAITTIGETADYLVRRLREVAGSPSGQCRTAHVFYSLRRELITRFNLPRRVVTPRSRIGDVLPHRARESWNDIATAVGLRPERRRLFSASAPQPGRTLREVIRDHATFAFVTADNRVDERAVLERVCRITAEQMGVDARDLHRETHYVRDLDMG